MNLKRCPFCNSNEVVINYHHAMNRTATKLYYGFCNECGTEGSHDLGESGAIERWNTRPLEAQLLEACERAFRRADDDPNISADSDYYKQLQAAIAAAKGDEHE